MEIGVFVQLVESLGFPAVMAVALLWLNRETVRRYEKLLSEFRVTIDNNTQAMNRIIQQREK